MVSARSCFACVTAVLCFDSALSVRHIEVNEIKRESKYAGFGDVLKHFDDRFQLVADLGYISWYPNFSQCRQYFWRSCNGEVTIEELRSGLLVQDGPLRDWQFPEVIPPQLLNVERVRALLPWQFRTLKPSGHFNRFPFDIPPIAKLLVASTRFDLSEIDFYVDDAILSILATGGLRGQSVTVQKWRGMIMILLTTKYFVDYTHNGWQFERLLTGAPIDYTNRWAPHHEHMQVLRIGDFNVLTSGKVDALGPNWKKVEIKIAAQTMWTKIMFQMISSGSEILQKGVVSGDVLRGIDEYGLRELFDKHPVDERKRLTGHIIEAFETIRTLVGNSLTPFNMAKGQVWDKVMLLPSVSARDSLLPSADVLEELFPSTPVKDCVHQHIEPENRTKRVEFGDALQHLDPLFQLVADLGFFSWHTNCSLAKPHSRRSCRGDVELEELRCGLGGEGGPPCGWRVPEAKPARLVNVDHLRARLPLHFCRLKPNGYRHRLPFEPPPVAPLVAASKRFDLSQVDFYIDGSILATLATGASGGKKFTVQRWGRMVMMLLDSDGFVDLAQRGYQFERLLTGTRIDKADRTAPHFGHLQVLRIGSFTVLVSAQVDALDTNQRFVELSAASKPMWRHIMFQMISAGSEWLEKGVVHRDSLRGIEEYDLRQVLDRYTPSERHRFTGNIIKALETIRTLVGDAQGPFALGKWNATGSPTLMRSEWKHSLLPSAEVMGMLFPCSTDDDGDWITPRPRRRVQPALHADTGASFAPLPFRMGLDVR